MSSSHSSAVEELLAQWLTRNPGSPIRAVVEHATDLGFAVLPPGGSGNARYLRLVLDAPTGETATLYVTPLRLAAAGAAVREMTAGLPGAVVGTRDVQLPFDTVDPFAVLDTVLLAFVGEAAPASTRPGATAVGLPVTVPVAAVPGERSRLPRPVLLAAAVAVLLLVIGAATGGFAGALVVLGVAVVLVGLAAVVAGRARWALIASRRIGACVAAAGVAVIAVGGGMTAPTPAPASAQSPAATSSSAAAAPTEDTEAATEAAEAALLAAETDETASVAVATNTATGLLSDAATDAAVGSAGSTTALAALAAVPVKGRAPQTGYDRAQFGVAWTDTNHNGCDTRNDVLGRDLTADTFKPGTRNCVVLTGSLADPYSGRTIGFVRGQDTSADVQIDHVVALSNAWQTGAQGWDVVKRTAFANDYLNLLAVDGPLNMQKGDGDAATWLPPNKSYRCAYVARQVAVKVTYGLWMTPAERNAVATVLSSCPAEPLPGGVVAAVPARSSAAATTAAGTTAVVVAPVPAPRTTAAPKPAPVVVPAPAPDPEPVVVPDPAPAAAYYANCSAVRAAGAAPIYAGEPGYSRKLDRDGDGVGCE